MRALLLLCLSTVGHGVSVEPGGAFNYHKSIGIPLAASIKASEDRSHAGRKATISTINEHPYLAGLGIFLVNNPNLSTCGASLLSANRLVSAAHCWFDGVSQARQYNVALGSNRLYYEGTHVVTTMVVMHPQWDPLWIRNDIAMIYLPYNVAFSSSIQPIAIPSGADINNKFIASWAVASGYGIPCPLRQPTTFDAVVRKMTLQVITEHECKITYGSYVTQGNICTSGCGGNGLCLGFSGGPLVKEKPLIKDHILIGIGSFTSKEACQLRYPTVFTRVTSYINFIASHM